MVLCHIRYIKQTKNWIKDRVQSHLYDIKSGVNTTVARHYKNHGDITNPPITILILELIKIDKKNPRSDTLRDSRKLAWIHRLDTLIPSGLNIMD